MISNYLNHKYISNINKNAFISINPLFLEGYQKHNLFLFGLTGFLKQTNKKQVSFTLLVTKQISNFYLEYLYHPRQLKSVNILLIGFLLTSQISVNILDVSLVYFIDQIFPKGRSNLWSDYRFSFIYFVFKRNYQQVAM